MCQSDLQSKDQLEFPNVVTLSRARFLTNCPSRTVLLNRLRLLRCVSVIVDCVRRASELLSLLLPAHAWTVAYPSCRMPSRTPSANVKSVVFGFASRVDARFATQIMIISGEYLNSSVNDTHSNKTSIWRWRNHYGESLGCLGTGIGDGDRGVICGREQKCLAAREREQEMDCDAEDAKGSVSGSSPGSSPDYLSRNSPLTPSSHATSYFPVTAAPQQSIESLVEEYRYQERTPSPLLGPGYERHEIEGIGGIVKRKIVRMVRIGACVPEWEDEKSHYNVPSASRVLGHEVRGEIRSWCGWCLRVVPGQKDRENMVRNQTIADGKVQTRFQQNVVQMPLRNGQQQHETKARVCPPVSS